MGYIQRWVGDGNYTAMSERDIRMGEWKYRRRWKMEVGRRRQTFKTAQYIYIYICVCVCVCVCVTCTYLDLAYREFGTRLRDKCRFNRRFFPGEVTDLLSFTTLGRL